MHLPSWPAWKRRVFAACAIGIVLAAGGLGLGGEALIRARLDQSLRRITTRFYARPPVIQVETRIDPTSLQRYLARLAYRRTDRKAVSAGQFRGGDNELTIGRRPFRAPGVFDPGGPVTIHVDDNAWVVGLEDSAGRSLTQVILEPEPIRTPGEGGDDRVPVPLEDVPQSLIDAVLTIEDRHFFEHSGIDFARIGGAAIANLRARGVEQGGSTITQQLAKNLFLSARRTPLRKIRELAFALVLELRYSKQEILEAYLNDVYLGQNGAYAIRGVGRAAQYYFGKDVSALGLGESAMLAGLIHGPNLYSPFTRPTTTINRRNLVLRLMRDRRLADAPTVRRVANSSLGVRRTAPPIRAGRYFADLAARELGERFQPHGRRALSVFTTLDMDLQVAAEAAVRSGLAQIESDHPGLRRGGSPLQAALVAVEPGTGEILALVGGRDYGVTQFNRAADARRQPGSAFKPVVALAALSGRSVTLASRLDDEPLRVETTVGLWEPLNYDGQFRGPVTLRQALESSLNVPFARLGLAVGTEEIIRTARRLGIQSPLRPVPSLALGSSEVTPLELTGAFAVFASGGRRSTPHAVHAAVDASGDLVEGTPQPTDSAYSPAETFLVTSALEGAVERGTGRGLRQWGYDGPIAAKSGTSNDYRDAWFVGYTPKLVLGVWVGFDDGRSLGLSGAQAALPIFARLLNAARQEDEESGFAMPEELQVASVDPRTGMASAEACGGETEYFLPGTAPVAGDECWTEFPHWIEEAGSKVVTRLGSLLERLFGRRRHRD